MKLSPYLNFNGNAEEAFNFYKSVFGGDFTAVMKMSDAPDSDKIPAEEKDRIMHISLPISQDITLMASDILPSMGHSPNNGNNVYLSLHPNTKEEADRLFKGLSQNGDIEMPMADQFWGDYFGSFVDQFGVHWMINYNPEF